jgi:hypothetical protein
MAWRTSRRVIVVDYPLVLIQLKEVRWCILSEWTIISNFRL